MQGRFTEFSGVSVHEGTKNGAAGFPELITYLYALSGVVHPPFAYTPQKSRSARSEASLIARPLNSEFD